LHRGEKISLLEVLDFRFALRPRANLPITLITETGRSMNKLEEIRLRDENEGIVNFCGNKANCYLAVGRVAD